MCVCTHVCACAHERVHVCVHTHVRAYVCVCVCRRMCTRMLCCCKQMAVMVRTHLCHGIAGASAEHTIEEAWHLARLQVHGPKVGHRLVEVLIGAPVVGLEVGLCV